MPRERPLSVALVDDPPPVWYTRNSVDQSCTPRLFNQQETRRGCHQLAGDDRVTGQIAMK